MDVEGQGEEEKFDGRGMSIEKAKRQMASLSPEKIHQ
jgi:hypothetical protein